MHSDDVRGYTQIVLNDGDRDLEDRGQRSIASLDVWRVTDLDAKRRLLLAALGWGRLPWHIAAADVANGALPLLNPVEWGIYAGLPELPVSIVRRKDRIPGLATQALLVELGARG